jgi:hypothetical protein
MLPRINAIRAELGVAPVASVDALMRRALLLLAVGGEPLEYPHPGWGDRVHLIGACAFEPGPAVAPAWLESIDRPAVLVTTSSLRQADTSLAVTALQALAAEPVHVVAHTQFHGVPVHSAQSGARPGDHPRRDGNDRQGARSRDPGVRGALRPRSSRSRSVSRGGPLRNAPARQEAQRDAATRQGRPSHDHDRRRAPCIGRFRGNRRCGPRSDVGRTVDAE